MLLEQSIRQAQSKADRAQSFLIEFAHTQYYLPEQPLITLLALLQISFDADTVPVIEGSIFAYTPEHLESLRCIPDNYKELKLYCERHSLPWLLVSDPWRLAPVYVAKPWGQEIWYTGIEARGQAGVQGEGGDIPLSWLLELMSDRIGIVDKRQPILLKVLDPLADEIYGDLYFELHEEKQEVYVVTHIDLKAWPGGIGAIQLGFAAQKRQHYQTDDEFKQAYLESVKEYECVRRLLDSRLDKKKVALGMDSNQPATASQLIYWIDELSQDTENKGLFLKEEALRQTMNSYVAHHPLAVGDVVAIPRFVPHALQHGVRVIEFQTPVYERKILSFAQKVLTQSHWDTEAAIGLADMEFAQLQPPECVIDDAQLRVERIVNFDDFEVLRIKLDGGYVLSSNDYSVLIVVQGSLSLNIAGKTNFIETGQALLIPKTESNWSINSAAPCIFLLASPH